MLRFIRRVLGMAVMATFLGYMITMVILRTASDPAQEAANITAFYVAVAASGMQMVYLACFTVFFLGSLAHAGMLLSSGNPARIAALVAFAGLVSMIFAALHAPVIAEASGTPRASAPEWMIVAILVVPFLVQIIDLVAPPWRRSPSPPIANATVMSVRAPASRR